METDCQEGIIGFEKESSGGEFIVSERRTKGLGKKNVRKRSNPSF